MLQLSFLLNFFSSNEEKKPFCKLSIRLLKLLCRFINLLALLEEHPSVFKYYLVVFCYKAQCATD